MKVVGLQVVLVEPKTGLETDIRIRVTVCLYTSTAYQVQTLHFVDSPSHSLRIWALHRRRSKSEFDRKVG